MKIRQHSIAILVAINIVWTGLQLVRRSSSGLMDTALPPEQLALINEVLPVLAITF